MKCFSFKQNTILAVLLVLICFNLNAANYYVDDNSSTGDVFCLNANGDDANDGLDADNPKLTFSNLIATYGAALTSGDTIFIDAGVYNGEEGYTLPASKFGITFIGAGYDKTIFDNQLAGAATDYFMYIMASNTTFANLSFTGYENNGTQTPGHSGQAITVGGNSGSPVTNVLFENVSFYNNGASGGNPAISVLAYSEVTLRGGGSYCNSPGTQYTGGVEVFGNNISLTIEDYILANNDMTANDGGGLRIEGGDNTFVNVSNTRISNNRANEGGAISQRNGILTMTDCIIDGNATVNGGTHYGGAYRITRGTSKFSRCIFSNNYGGGSSCRGGAIGARYSSTGGFSTNKTITIQLDSCVFENNSPGTKGSDIYGAATYACNITAVDCQFLTGGNYNVYSDGTSPATSIVVTYFGTQPTKSGVNVTRTLSTNTLYTPTPSPPEFTGVCGAITILSVDLASFTGDCQGDEVDIQWATISEDNNDYFIIEKSQDGEYFEEVATIDGAGNSTELLHYSISDRKLNKQPVYYRLTQVDFDGERTVFPLIVIDGNCNDEQKPIEVTANLSSNTILVYYDLPESKNTVLNLYDLKGKMIYAENVFLSKNKKVYESNVLKSLEAGMYIIQLTGENIDQASSKFIIGY